jgi:hypothetical protein
MKWEDLARAFRERHFVCAGMSKTGLTGTGVCHDEASSVCLVHQGLATEEQKAGGK